ncbi:MAG: ArsR/SmtB family transcription factor [Burkholderiales bacterium]
MPLENYRTSFYAQLARLGKAISNNTRLEIIDLLAQGERTVDSVSTELGVPLPNTSHHLHKLLQNGVVKSRKAGVHVHFRLSDNAVSHFVNALAKVAEANLLEFEKLVNDYLTTRDNLEPLDADELSRRMREGSVTVIDARPPDEYAIGHLPGAINLPFWEIDPPLENLPKDREIVAYCRGPYCILSYEATAKLRSLGYSVRRLRDGFPDWKDRGLPVVYASA